MKTKKRELSNICDMNGELIPYGVPIDFTWWSYYGTEVELHLVAKLRKRKSGDIFEFIKDEHGQDCFFTHRLTSLNWCPDDLVILNEN